MQTAQQRRYKTVASYLNKKVFNPLRKQEGIENYLSIETYLNARSIVQD